MSGIDTTAQIVKLMQTRLNFAQSAKKESFSTKDKIKSAGKNKAIYPTDKSTIREQQLLTQIATISNDDPQRHEKAFKFFMESVFTREFGFELHGNVELEELLDQVIHKMHSDAHLRAAMLKAAENLLLGIPPNS